MIFCRRKCAMNIHVTKDAAAWYKNEYDIDTASIRFFVRYGGLGGNVPGFSLGVHLEEPLNTHTSIKVNGILFFVDRKSTRLNSSHVSISYAVFCLINKQSNEYE